MAVSIYIPLDPHLVKYMEREAMRRNGTYKAVKTSFFGNYVLGALENMPEGERPGAPDCSHLVFQIPDRYAESHGNWMSPRNRDLISTWIRKDYEKEFMLFVRENHLKWGLSYLQGIEKWRERYGITENIRKFETDQRYFTRKKSPQKLS